MNACDTLASRQRGTVSCIIVWTVMRQQDMASWLIFCDVWTFHNWAWQALMSSKHVVGHRWRKKTGAGKPGSW